MRIAALLALVWITALAMAGRAAETIIPPGEKTGGAAQKSSPNGGGVLSVSMPELLESAALRISGPAPQSEAGLPIGNGRMGTLLWTSPRALRMQINRVDVFANNRDSNSFPERHTDYCGGCAFVDIDAGAPVFTERMKQHLSLVDGLATVRDEGVELRAQASMRLDVIAIQVTDRRQKPAPISVRLRILRPPLVRHLQHRATSTLDASGERIVLAQAFEEGNYYSGSAVAVAVVGREGRIPPNSDNEIKIDMDASAGTFTVLIASAANFDRAENVVDAALAQLDQAAKTPSEKNTNPDVFESLAAENRLWWSEFWNRGFVRLHSADAAAEMVQEHYNYWLYLIASTSRGEYPTKFNGMLWTTGGDRRQWGGQYWGANQSCLYQGLFPANRVELLDPMFSMYTGMATSCATAARQQWGSQGLFIPETVAFDGLGELPEPIAAEMRELYLARKPMSQASRAFLEYARMKQPHSSRWNWWESGKTINGQWQPKQRGEAPFGPVTHIFSRGAKIAYMYWQRYEYTGDEQWLRDRAYPMLRGVAEFYRNFPNTKKGADGKYHIHLVNSNESVRGGQDADEELAAMRGIFPALIRASEILELDADMRPVWKEFVENLAPLPRSDVPSTGLAPAARGVGSGAESASETPPTLSKDGYWIRALPPIISGNGSRRSDGNTMPMWFFDLCTLENQNVETRRLAGNTLDGYGPAARGVLSEVGIAQAKMGRGDAVRRSLLSQLTSPDRAPAMANRMDLREGAQTTSAQRLGRAADTLHNALLQSTGAGPAEEPVIRVFPAWPKDWDAQFTLLARGNVLVTSSIKNNEIEFISLEPNRDGHCRVRNPWPQSTVLVLRGASKTPQPVEGSFLELDTTSGERLILRKSPA